jgi:hypothetical protein
MRLGRFPTLLLAAVLAGPAIWRATVTGDLDPRTALMRFLIAVPVAGVMLAFLRSLATGYQVKGAAAQPQPPLRVEAVTGEPMMPQRRAGDPSG